MGTLNRQTIMCAPNFNTLMGHQIDPGGHIKEKFVVGWSFLWLGKWKNIQRKRYSVISRDDYYDMNYYICHAPWFFHLSWDKFKISVWLFWVYSDFPDNPANLIQNLLNITRRTIDIFVNILWWVNHIITILWVEGYPNLGMSLIKMYRENIFQQGFYLLCTDLLIFLF